MLTAPRFQRGLTIIEMMVGFAVGLFIVGGATKLFVDYLTSNRKLLLETRLTQDLRAATDLIARDLRRAGYWQNAIDKTWVADASNNGGTFTDNPYRTVNVTTDGSSVTCPATTAPSTTLTTGDHIEYGYAKDNDDAQSDTTEKRGFRVNGYALQTYIGGDSWQAITDTNVIKITQLSVCQYSTEVPLHETCSCFNKVTCLGTDFTNTSGTYHATRPRSYISQYVISMTATSPTDSTVTRSVSETVRIRNDQLTGTCPNV